MPARCKAQAGYEGFDAADMEVFSITYTDCAEAWTMCRHKDSQVTQIEMIDVFGRLPVRMRNYARHVIGELPFRVVRKDTVTDDGSISCRCAPCVHFVSERSSLSLFCRTLTLAVATWATSSCLEMSGHTSRCGFMR